MNEIKKINNNIEKLKEYENKFLNYMDNSPKTSETYEIALKRFFNYLIENDIKNPTRDDIIDYKKELMNNMKPTSVNSYIIAVKSFFKWLEYEGLYKNITENVKTIKLEKRHLKLGLEQEQLLKVLENCKDLREELIIKLSVTCGLRCNEIVNIQLKDFYNDNGTIMLKILGKGRNGIKQDVVKIDTRIYDLIKKYCYENNINDYLFVSNSNNNNGNKLTTKTIRLLIKNIFKRANLDNIELYSAHSLRHTSVVLALKSGIPIQEVSECMRHSQINTTMVYMNEINKKESNFSNVLADLIS